MNSNNRANGFSVRCIKDETMLFFLLLKQIKMKHLFTIAILLLVNNITYSQTITGNLSQQQGQVITLTGFNYLDAVVLATDTITPQGNFNLSYPKDYKGMALLKTQDNTQLPLVLTEPLIHIKATSLAEPNTLTFINSPNNKQFNTLIQQYTQRTQAYQAWRYLQPLYTNTKTNKAPINTQQTITSEIQRIEQANATAANILPANSYERWFLPLRQLVNEMPNSAKVYTERIPKNIQQFRTIDFTNVNFKTSGLLKQLIEGHFMLIEKQAQPKDSMFAQMNTSTQYLINQLQTQPELLNIVSKHLFHHFEKRSLFKASEYLSINLLEHNQCELEENLTAKLESYRKLKVGNTAPNIQLTATKKLSDIKTNKLVVFGASWCPHCKTDTAEIEKLYNTWQQHNTEVVYVSIDEDEKEFNAYYNTKPWQTYCDFKGWDTQAAKDYYITGTPSYFLLDANNKILVRPNTVLHANVWITQKL